MIFLRFKISKILALNQYLISYSLYRQSSKGDLKTLVADKELKYTVDSEQIQQGFILNLTDLVSLCELVKLSIAYSAHSISEVKR